MVEHNEELCPHSLCRCSHLWGVTILKQWREACVTTYRWSCKCYIQKAESHTSHHHKTSAYQPHETAFLFFFPSRKFLYILVTNPLLVTLKKKCPLKANTSSFLLAALGVAVSNQSHHKYSLQRATGLAQGLWHTITGPSLTLLSDILLLPQVMEIL